MRKSVVTASVLLLALCVLVVWLFGRRPPALVQESNWTTQPLRAGTNRQQGLEELAGQKGVPLNVLTQQGTMEFSNALAQELNRPVEFHGKALDQSGLPVGGAKVEARYFIFPEEEWATNVTTDASGLFALHGVGRAVSASISKDGYEEVPGTNEHHFMYYGVANGFRPDSNNPVVFWLRKKGEQQK